MAAEALLALSTFPDEATARNIAHQLVGEKLVACANMVPRVESIYRWEGKIESASEVLVVFKLSSDTSERFQEKLRALHPYEVPEILLLSIAGGLPEYVRWVTESCS